ncbi:hypothetical protein BDN71DRAFT_345241 [Pleurotus eryngii]|uniref:Uncharacterized protein n=1 Tax=Pleurotus eryngii TaxID=5323 RepID=A0A9P6A467_PLEER|nr:hypothetical protein BDN71DRAFT_345241 [Pleurotus eryngii]
MFGSKRTFKDTEPTTTTFVEGSFNHGAIVEYSEVVVLAVSTILTTMHHASNQTHLLVSRTKSTYLMLRLSAATTIASMAWLHLVALPSTSTSNFVANESILVSCMSRGVELLCVSLMSVYSYHVNLVHACWRIESYASLRDLKLQVSHGSLSTRDAPVPSPLEIQLRCGSPHTNRPHDTASGTCSDLTLTCIDTLTSSGTYLDGGTERLYTASCCCGRELSRIAVPFAVCTW